VATVPVIVPAFRPNDRPLELAKVNALARFEVVPALNRIFEIVAAFESIAVVRYGPMLTEIPVLFMVPEALVPAKAAVAWTKSEPRFDAIAVVRNCVVKGTV